MAENQNLNKNTGYPDVVFSGSIREKIKGERFLIPIDYRIASPVTDLEKLIISYIRYKGSTVIRNELAQALGFAIADDPDRHIYYDPAEVALFDFIISGLIDYGLITHLGGKLNLTPSAADAIDNKRKYFYFKGFTGNFNFTRLLVDDDFDFKAIGFPATLIENNRLTGYINLSKNKDDKYLNDLENQIRCIEKYDTCDLLSAGKPYYYAPDELETDILFNSLNASVSVIFNGEVNEYLTSCFNNPKNLEYREELRRQGAFNKLWANEETDITWDDLVNFSDQWVYSDLLRSQRLNWEDDRIVKHLITHMEANDWLTFSEYLPVPLLVQHFEDFLTQWNWQIITKRLDEQFILKRFTTNGSELKYAWDFEELSNKSASFIETALWKNATFVEHYDFTWEDFRWNWPILSESLPDEVILNGLSKMPFNKTVLSERSGSFLQKALREVSQISDCSWNWTKLQDKISPDFLFDHLIVFSPFLDWKELTIRVFSPDFPWPAKTDRVYFLDVMNSQASSIRPFTMERLPWDNYLIEWFDTRELLRWTSTLSQPGFELNPNIVWDEETFEKFSKKITTNQGRTHISKVISSLSIIEDYPDFGWNWDMISGNTTIAWPKRALLHFADRLNWQILLSRIPNDELITTIAAFDNIGQLTGSSVRESIWKYLNNALPVSALLSEYDNYPDYIAVDILSIRDPNLVIDFILETENLLLSWNWPAIAQKADVEHIVQLLPVLNQFYFFNSRSSELDFIKKFWLDVTPRLDEEFLVSHALTYRNEWDWKYLSKHLSKEILKSNLNAWQEKLDWTYLTKETFDKTEIKDIISDNPNIATRLWWPHVINNALTPDDLLERLYEIAKIVNRITDKTLKKETWSNLTKRIPIEGIFPEIINKPPIQRLQFEKFLKFDWSFLSSDERLHPHLTVKFLDTYYHFWDWKTLSQNSFINDNWTYLKAFRKKWDWTYLSQYSRFMKPKRSFAENKKTYQDFHLDIDWAAFSLREDLQFEHSLLIRYSGKGWDWTALSASKMLQVDASLLERLPDKPWNWQLLSQNSAVSMGTEFLISFGDKNWDWQSLSARRDLIPEFKLFEVLSDKPWDFTAISRRVDFEWTPQLFKLLKDKPLDWEFISRKAKVYWDKQTLTVLQKKFDWDLLSLNLSVPLGEEWFDDFSHCWNFKIMSKRTDLVSVPEIIIRHKNASWDWDVLSAREDFDYSPDVLEVLKEYLSWPALSKKYWKRFEASWLENFREKWDWIALSENDSVTRDKETAAALSELFANDHPLEFRRRVHEQASRWKGYVYHFAHLTNAAQIILSGQILSRHKAELLKNGFANAAGNVVARRDEAHNYARFYFRPQTPTQFYNEMLGMSETSKYYHRALLLGLPKCPVPVFFRFPLKEVLDKNPGKCFASNGNMQTNWAQVFPVGPELLNQFDFDFLYMTSERVGQITKNKVGGYDPEYFRQIFGELFQRQQTASQQEFLIRDIFKLSEISGIEIIVSNENSRQALLQFIGTDHPLAENIRVDDGSLNIFHYNNPGVDYTIEGNELSFSTHYSRPHELVFESISAAQTEILDGFPIKQGSRMITAEKHINLRIDPFVPFTLKFRDEKRQEWVIFENRNLNPVSYGDNLS